MKVIISLLIAALILVAIFFYGLFGGTSNPNDQVNTSTDSVEPVSEDTTDNEPQEFTGEATLSAIEALGQNLECRISYVAPDQIEPIIGTYFVSMNRIRGDFEMNVPELGGDVVSSIIMSNNEFYSWSRIDGEGYGIKFDTSATTESDRTTERQPVPSDAKVSYDCKTWEAVDGSIFEPPSDVLFQDASNLLESGMEYGTVYEEGEF